VFFSGLLVLKVVVAYVYLESIVTSYGYYGFSSVPVNAVVSLTNWIVYLLCSAVMTTLIEKNRVSSWIITLLFCLSYIPCLVYFEESGAPFMYFVQLHIYWLLLIILLKRLPRVSLSLSRNDVTQEFLGRRAFVGEIIVAALALYVCMIKYRYNGLYIHFDVVEVYALRLEAADKNLGFGSHYFISWACLAFTIRGVLAFSNRQFFILALMFFLQVVIFSIAAHKFYLFALPVALMASAFYREGMLNWVPLLMAASLLAFEYLNSVFGIFYFTFMLPFRNMFLPALITGNFYDFFESHPPDFLTQSVLGRLGFVSDYTLPIPYLIDAAYHGSGGSANTGLSADAISNFGFLGVLIYPILFAFSLILLDSASREIKFKNNLGIIIFFTIGFLNMAFFTALLTGGVLFSLFFLSTQASKEK
jgi:hypothetical protein